MISDSVARFSKIINAMEQTLFEIGCEITEKCTNILLLCFVVPCFFLEKMALGL